MDVKIGSVAPFDMGGMREKAIKPLEEAAEVFVAWQDIDRMSATFCSVDEVSAETMASGALEKG